MGESYGVSGEVVNTEDCGSSIRRFESRLSPQVVGSNGKVSTVVWSHGVLSSILRLPTKK